MPDDEAADDGNEVTLLFDETDAEPHEPRLLRVAGTGLPGFSTLGVSASALTGLTGQLEKLAASQAVPASQIFKDSIFSWSKMLGQFDHGPQFVGMSTAVSSFTEAFTKDLKIFDQASSSFMLTQQEQQALTAAWCQNVFGLSALTSWRTSLAIESSLAPVVRSLAEALDYQSSWADDLLRVTAAQVNLTDWVVGRDAGAGLLGAVSGKPLSLWQDYVDIPPVTPDAKWLRTSLAAGSATSGLLGADVLESAIEDDELVRATVERVELDVLTVSAPGRLRAARELYARLAEIDPAVPELLEGAWDDIDRNGPAAVSKAANCVVEVLDRTLRAAAPDGAVREWHTRTRRLAKEFGAQGQMTRPLRVRYLAAEIGGTKELVVAQYESLTTLLDPLYGRLQAAKHASASDVTQVRSLLLTAESFLTVLFLSTID